MASAFGGHRQACVSCAETEVPSAAHSPWHIKILNLWTRRDFDQSAINPQESCTSTKRMSGDSVSKFTWRPFDEQLQGNRVEQTKREPFPDPAENDKFFTSVLSKTN